jgi:hypothetical protein
MKLKFKETFLYHLLQLLKFKKRDYFYQIHDFDGSEHEQLLDHYLECPFKGAGFIDQKRYEVISCEVIKTKTDQWGYEYNIYSVLVKIYTCRSIWEQHYHWNSAEYKEKYNYYKKIIDDKRKLEQEINELNKKKNYESNQSN